MKNLKPKKLRCFKQIPFPSWKETWKCTCGAITSTILCINCGKTKLQLKEEKRRARNKEFAKQINAIFAKE